MLCGAILFALGCTRSTAEQSPRGDSAAPAAAGTEGHQPGQRIPAFEAAGIKLGADGKETPVAVSSRTTARPTAYVFVGTQCGTTAQYLGRLAALETAYADKIDFVFLYPNSTDSAQAKREFHARHKLRSPMVDDTGAKIALQLGGERTAELVLAGKDGIIAYRGAIDDNKEQAQVKRNHFQLAANEHLAGKPVSQPKTIGTA